MSELKERRIAKVSVSPQLVADIITNGTRATTTIGMPKGAKLVSDGYNHQSNCWDFFFTHKSFAKIKVGEIPPIIDVTIAEVNNE